MKILIVEDSLGLVNVYQNIIKNIIKKNKPSEEVEIISIVNYNEYLYFHDMKFDFAIFDWNIIGGTSQKIVEEAIDKIKHSVFITGYANNKEVQMIAKEYSIPIMSKPTTEFEITSILENTISSIYNKNAVMV